MKKCKLLLLLLLLMLTLTGCKSSEPGIHNFKKVKVGMTPEKVFSLLGEYDDVDTEKYFQFCYWFDGATSMEDAQKKTEKGKIVKYYCVIFFAEDQVTYKIESKEDIFSGIWGVS